MSLDSPRTNFGNPVSRENLPSQRLEILWPVKEIWNPWAMAGYLVGLITIFLSPVLFLVAIPKIIPALLEMGTGLFWIVLIGGGLLIHGFIVLKPWQWAFVLAIVAMGLMTYLPIELLAIVTSWALPLFAIRFRNHYLGYCSAAPIPPAQAKQFRQTRRTPVFVRPAPLGVDFRNAIENWLSYNPHDCRLPGQWASPSGSHSSRLIQTTFVAALIVATFVKLPSVLSGFEGQQYGGWIALGHLLAYIAPLPVFLLGLFGVSYPILGKAGGLRRSATLANYWDAYLEATETSSNTAERDSLYLGHVVADSSPILLPLSVSGQHMWIVGATGSGKTVKLINLLEQYVRRGYSVVCVDLKADSFELLYTLNALANRSKSFVDQYHFTDRYGWATQLCSPFAQSSWTQLSPSERTNIHLAAMGIGFSRDHGASWFGDACYEVLDFVNRKYPDVGSYEELSDRLTYELAHAGPHELSRSVKKDGEHASLILKRLSHVEMFNPKPNHPQSAVDAALDFSTLFATQTVAYWGLNCLVAPITSAEISRVVLASLLSAGTSIQTSKRNVVLVIDEFQQMVAPGVLQLALRQARSVGIEIILSNQAVDDLKTSKNNFVPTVEGNTATQMWLSGAGRDSIEQIQKLAGKFVDKTYSTSVNSEGGLSRTESEMIVDRFDATTIAKASSGKGQFIVRINSNEDYAQYNGIPFIARSDFHMKHEEYQRRSNALWPRMSARTVVVGNPPLPTPKSGSVPAVPPPTTSASTSPTAPNPVAAQQPNPRVAQPPSSSRNIIGSGTLGKRRRRRTP